MKKYLKDIIKSCILEGRIERSVETSEELLNRLKDRVMIFFDTETTGLDPKKKYVQITEIAAVAYDTSNGNRIGEYSMKAHLSDKVKKTIERQDQAKIDGTWRSGTKPTISDLLKMTKYYEGNVPYDEEERVLRGYADFIKSFSSKNPILVAHNAKFDMYQIGKGYERYKIMKPSRYEVLDTMTLTKNYIFPILSYLENKRHEDPEINSLLNSLKPEKRFLNRLGNLGTAFNVSTEHWHSAIADAEQLSGITSALIKFLDSRKDSDLRLGRDLMAGNVKYDASGQVISPKKDKKPKS